MVYVKKNQDASEERKAENTKQDEGNYLYQDVEILGPGLGKSAQYQLLPYSGHSPGCSQSLLLSGRISACSCTDTAPDALSIGCSQVG